MILDASASLAMFQPVSDELPSNLIVTSIDVVRVGFLVTATPRVGRRVGMFVRAFVILDVGLVVEGLMEEE